VKANIFTIVKKLLFFKKKAVIFLEKLLIFLKNVLVFDMEFHSGEYKGGGYKSFYTQNCNGTPLLG